MIAVLRQPFDTDFCIIECLMWTSAAVYHYVLPYTSPNRFQDLMEACLLSVALSNLQAGLKLMENLCTYAVMFALIRLDDLFSPVQQVCNGRGEVGGCEQNQLV